VRPWALATSIIAAAPRTAPGRTVEEDEEAVSGGLCLASAEALDLGAHSLIVFGEQQAPLGVADAVQRLG